MPSEPASWTLILLYLGAGFVLLAKGADWLVSGSSIIARRLGVSVLIIGLTVVAFGTSAPEVVVSGLAAWEGYVDLSLGNALGSNIANIGLVLGASALVLPSILEARLKSRELFWLVASLGLLWFLSADHRITRVEALVLLGVFVLFNLHLFFGARKEAREAREARGREVPSDGHRYPLFWVVLGTLSIGLGAKLVLDAALGGAQRLAIPESVVGLTIVAIGTSLPELAAGVGGALRGERDISLGNVIGSNVFNLLGVIGTVGLIQPFDPDDPAIANPAGVESAFESALAEDLWVVLGFSLLAVVLPILGGARGGRSKGLTLLLLYAVYSVWLFATRG
jgi:cation:H+ antiporter